MKIYKYLDKAEKHIKVKMFMLNMYRIKFLRKCSFIFINEDNYDSVFLKKLHII